MNLHQVAAAMRRACTRLGGPSRNRKARILSNEAEFSQDIQFELRKTRFQTAKR
jgi:hypothetical protein